jgi:hypothetical protein
MLLPVEAVSGFVAVIVKEAYKVPRRVRLFSVQAERQL